MVISDAHLVLVVGAMLRHELPHWLFRRRDFIEKIIFFFVCEIRTHNDALKEIVRKSVFLIENPVNKAYHLLLYLVDRPMIL